MCFFQIKGRYGPDLDSLAGGAGGHVVGVMVDNESRLHLLVNGVDQGVAAKEIPPNPYVVLDLYGQCQEVRVQPFTVYVIFILFFAYFLKLCPCLVSHFSLSLFFYFFLFIFFSPVPTPGMFLQFLTYFFKIPTSDSAVRLLSIT